ncbi:MAG: hypothetical protein K8R59_05335, partial [Thermoanaerobaculales bacterium]|nr:hypothetical protein [Thermoanaerobaculales bacterium]
MKKFLTLALAGAMVLGLSSVVFANICAFDPVPAATLLFPFVEYDYSHNGATTAFAITNVSSEAQVVHITLWTDYSVAILDFNVLLTGYDVQTFDIGSILRDGDLPQTGPTFTESDFDDPHSDGPISETNFLNGDWIEGLLDPPGGAWVCTDGNPSEYGPGTIPQDVLDLFEGWLKKSQGGASRAYSDQCDQAWPFAGASGTDVMGTWWQDDAFNAGRATWMYITADVVQYCNKLFPFQTGYFDDGLRSDDNVLMGDVFQLNGATGFSSADNAVHIEADLDLIAVASEGNPGFPASFYARYSNNDGIQDYREPLPTAWAFRYLNGPDFTTHIRAWKGGILLDAVNWEWPIVADLHLNSRDHNVSSMVASNCLAYTYYAWDEEENVTTSSDNPWSQPGGEYIVPNLLPLETQEVDVNEFTLPREDNGWMLFVWPASNFYNANGVMEQYMPDMYQTWMGVRYTAYGVFTEGISGVVMANYNCFCGQVLPQLGINFDYVG